MATGEVCVLDPREIYAAGSGGWEGGVDQPEMKRHIYP